MTAKDLGRKSKTEVLKEAFNKGDEASFSKAMVKFAEDIKDDVLKEAQAYNSDQTVLTSRGQHALTNKETKFYNAVVANGSFAGVEELVPATVFERVFEFLTTEHALLKEINFVNVTGVAEFVVSKGVNPAWWGKLCEEIKQVLDNGFDVINMKQYKLSAFMPVCKAMLDLGPVWLDKYVRTVLIESLQIALEEAIINGTGKDQPIGMMRDLSSVTDGVYAEKEAVPMLEFSPTEFGKMMAKVGEVKVGDEILQRSVSPDQVLMAVNPNDYWLVVYPRITVLNADGIYVQTMPLPFKVIQSVSVTKGKLVVGLGADYFLGLGSTLKLEASDEYRFVEDERVYLAKQYGNGQPKSNEAYTVYDISSMSPTESKK